MHCKARIIRRLSIVNAGLLGAGGLALLSLSAIGPALATPGNLLGRAPYRTAGCRARRHGMRHQQVPVNHRADWRIGQPHHQRADGPVTPPTPVEKASCNVSADYTIPSSIYGDVVVVDEIDITNTGTLPVTVRCRMGWQLEGYPDITQRKTTDSISVGGSAVLDFRRDEGSFSGNGENIINLIQPTWPR